MDNSTGVPSSANNLPRDYEHTRMFLSVAWEPGKVFEAVNRSAADPAVSDVDRNIEATCKEYLAASEERRAKLRQAATNGWSLLHFAHRMAIRAMRTGDIDCIRLGLVSIAIENASDDPRETITKLAMLNHAASHIGCSFAAIAEEALKVPLPQVSAYIREFVARDRDLQSLEAFALREMSDSNGPWIAVGCLGLESKKGDTGTQKGRKQEQNVCRRGLSGQSAFSGLLSRGIRAIRKIIRKF